MNHDGRHEGKMAPDALLASACRREPAESGTQNALIWLGCFTDCTFEGTPVARAPTAVVLPLDWAPLKLMPRHLQLDFTPSLA
ncbi:MAG: hypothetical protein ACT4P7_20155 [Gemmatimonadaceae bacterium]